MYLIKLVRLCRRVFLRLLPIEKQARIAGVRLGDNNFVASHFWSSEGYLIEVGSNCQITAGVKFLTHGGGPVLRDEIPDYDSFGKIKIGNYVYIGANSLIMPGVTIKDNVLIAAGSVVTKSVPARVVVAGNPAKIICTIDEYRERNLKYNMNSKNMSIKNKKAFLLSADDAMFIKKNYMN